MVEIVNTIINFINNMIVIDFSSIETTLPTQVINLYTTYTTIFFKYFAVGLLILGFFKFLKFVFSIGGYNK